LSGNAIDNLAPKLFQDLKNLLILDLSSNKLDQYLSPAAFSTLPTSIRHLDISSKLANFFWNDSHILAGFTVSALQGVLKGTSFLLFALLISIPY
jgi:hypothetical protein